MNTIQTPGGAADSEGLREPVLVESAPRSDDGHPNAGDTLEESEAAYRSLQQQTEQNLKRSLDLLRAITEGTTDAIYAKDTQGRYLMINTPGTHRVARSLEEILGRDDTELFSPETAADIMESDRLVMESGETCIQERVRVAAGVERIYQSTRRPLRDDAGKIIGVVGISRDITQKKEQERDLKESEARTRLILQTTLDAVVEIDAASRIIGWNLQAEATFGWTHAEVIGRPLTDTIIPAQFTEMHLRGMAHFAMSSEGPLLNRRIEITARRRDGTEFPIEIAITPIQTAHGVTFSAFIRDISVRKRSEEMLRKSESLHRATVGGIADGVLVIDGRGKVLSINPAFAGLHGLETGGQGYDALSDYPHSCECTDLEGNVVRPDAWPAARALQGETVRNMVLRVRNRNTGAEFIGSYTTSPVFDEGHLAAVVITIHDITAIKEAETALLRANDELEARVADRTTQIMEVNAQLLTAMVEAERANHAKSEFLSRMSHELRTPLNAILGFGQILDRETLTPLQNESVQYILKGGRHLLELINEVLDIARVEAGHIDLSLETIALREIVAESCALVRPLAQEHSVLLKECDATLGRSHVRADRQRLKQVLLNLLSNAVKYNRTGGEVRIHALALPNDRLRIAVQDTGPGITSEDQQKLFTPFERLDAANTGIEGTGLGLVIAQRLVTAMGGHLTLESLPGEGTTFFVELPLAPSPEEAQPDNRIGICEPEPSAPSQQQATVLYIEDNLSNLRLLEVVLRSRPGITLQAAMQGSVGLDLARQHVPDLILLDLNLPDISGREVLARLQGSALTCDIPVIVLSADATDAQIERLRSAGARAYLTKPLDVAEFLHMLDTMLSAMNPDSSTDEDFTI